MFIIERVIDRARVRSSIESCGNVYQVAGTDGRQDLGYQAGRFFMGFDRIEKDFW